MIENSSGVVEMNALVNSYDESVDSWLEEVKEILDYKGTIEQLQIEMENACVDTHGEYDAGTTPYEMADVFDLHVIKKD